MAAQIYSAPKEIKQPSYAINYSTNFNGELARIREEEKKYLKDLKDWLAKAGYTGKNSGEVIQFPVADGYAQYMVISMKPLRLVHIPLGDAWDFQYAHRLTAKDVQEKIDGQKSLEKLFGGGK